jgi:predicted RNase H-like HicB family nuclease
MKYQVTLIHSDEGYAVGCPALPGCWSQGDTEAAALENIASAIREYLEVRQEQGRDAPTITVREIDVA